VTQAPQRALEQTPRSVARQLVDASQPRSRELHLIRGAAGLHLLVVDGNRLFDVDEAAFAELDEAARSGDPAATSRLLDALGVTAPRLIDDTPLASVPVRALSLAVAQKCNLACTYCYAQEGDFGGAAKNMPLETALAAVDLLLADAAPGERVNLAFLGGEPLVNRSVLRAATERAAEQAAARGIAITFSITTNGTLVGPEDGDFFEQHGFAVTVSVDGLREAHDLLRPYKSGRGSYDTILENVRPLLARQRRMQVSARVTVTPRNLRLGDALDELVALGFHSVGFSPMLRSPTGRDEMSAAHLERMLGEMVACGDAFERRIASGERYPFANMVNAMREIHRGTHRPYPCGPEARGSPSSSIATGRPRRRCSTPPGPRDTTPRCAATRSVRSGAAARPRCSRRPWRRALRTRSSHARMTRSRRSCAIRRTASRCRRVRRSPRCRASTASSSRRGARSITRGSPAPSSSSTSSRSRRCSSRWAPGRPSSRWCARSRRRCRSSGRSGSPAGSAAPTSSSRHDQRGQSGRSSPISSPISRPASCSNSAMNPRISARSNRLVR
jgi:uncharacterized protein